jgi:hypothetical protein
MYLGDVGHHGVCLTLDDTQYHRIDTSDIPAAYAECDVKLDDNGTKFDCIITAGLVGIRVCDSKDEGPSGGGKKDILRPVSGWWMFVKLPEGQDTESGRHFRRRRNVI